MRGKRRRGSDSTGSRQVSNCKDSIGGDVERLFFILGNKGGRPGRKPERAGDLFVEMGREEGWAAAGRAGAGGLIWKNKALQGQVFDARRGKGADKVRAGGLFSFQYRARSGPLGLSGVVPFGMPKVVPNSLAENIV